MSEMLLAASGRREVSVRENGVVPVIIVIAIAVLLLLASSIVAGAIVLCAQHGAVLDAIVDLGHWTVKVVCHKA
ncbi:hypothetical protein BH09ACT6_BH09ACT6_17600 [soil metagenome]